MLDRTLRQTPLFFIIFLSSAAYNSAYQILDACDVTKTFCFMECDNLTLCSPYRQFVLNLFFLKQNTHGKLLMDTRFDKGTSFSIPGPLGITNHPDCRLIDDPSAKCPQPLNAQESDTKNG